MKIFSILTIALLVTFQTVGFAAKGTFSASGEYLMSDYDTPEIAEKIALDFAKQNAADQAGIYLESYSRSSNFNLEMDEIKTVASSKVEVLTKNIIRQPQSNGRILLHADITASVDTSELDNFIRKTREQRQQIIQQYKDLQEMNAKIKRDIDALQTKLAVIKDEIADDDLLIEQERINREFLSKQKIEEFAYKPFENEEVKYDITRIKYDITLIDEAIKFNPKNIPAHVMKAFFASSTSHGINDINKAQSVNSDSQNSAALHAMRALSYLSKGDLNQALEEYNKAIQLDPKSSTYYQVRASFYESRLKDYDKALADYTTAIKLNPKDVEIYKSRSKLYESQEKYSEAINDYKTILKFAPEESDTCYEKIGDMYKKLKDYPHAIEYYNKAIKLEPEQTFADHRVSAYLSRAWLYEEQKEYDKAIADCDTGIALANSAMGKINKTGVDSLLRDSYASVLIPALEDTKKRVLKTKNETKILTDKIKDYTQVLKLDPKNQLAYQKRGSIYLFFLKDYKAALADFNALIKLNPKFANYRGLTYEKLGEWEKALADYNKALELSPNNEYIEKNRQRVLEKLYPDRYTVETFLEQATFLRESKNYDRAIEAYTKALERDSENQDALFYRGLTYIYTKKYYSALKDYNKLIELNPNLAEAYKYRGQVHSESKNYNSAISDYTKYLNFTPNDENALFNRGMCYINEGRYKEAIEDYDKLLALNPNYHSNAYNNRAVAYENLNNLEKALTDYNKALTLNPNNELAKSNRQRILDKMK